MINFSLLYRIPTSFVGLRAKELIMAMKQRLEVFNLSLSEPATKNGQNLARASRHSKTSGV
jgi:hypothetical protein